jgi:hypothetical protein
MRGLRVLLGYRYLDVSVSHPEEPPLGARCTAVKPVTTPLRVWVAVIEVIK